MVEPTMELEALTMTDSGLARAQSEMVTAIVDDVQRIRRLHGNASVASVTSALRLKLGLLETLNSERRSRRALARSRS